MTKAPWLSQPHDYWILFVWGTNLLQKYTQSSCKQIWGLTLPFCQMSLDTSESPLVSSWDPYCIRIKKLSRVQILDYFLFQIVWALPLCASHPAWGPIATWSWAFPWFTLITASLCFQKAMFTEADCVFFCSLCCSEKNSVHKLGFWMWQGYLSVWPMLWIN